MVYSAKGSERPFKPGIHPSRLGVKNPPGYHYRQEYRSGQNNFQVESPHSPVVYLRPTDLSAANWIPPRGTHQSVSFHKPFLSELKIRT